MNDGTLVLAYHGCDVTLRDKLVSGRAVLKPSSNSYDWLGNGSYFFEGDAERALLFAEASNAHPDMRYTREPIATPAVVGAVLDVSRWLDMTTQEGISHYRSGYQSLTAAYEKSGKEMPENRAASEEDSDVILRELDREVFNMVHAQREIQQKKWLEAQARGEPTDLLPTPPFQAVRAAFSQGKPVARSSAFSAHSHVQIALRDSSCIKGWFLPRGQTLLSAEQLQMAEEALTQAKTAQTAKKRRVRPTRR